MINPIIFLVTVYKKADQMIMAIELANQQIKEMTDVRRQVKKPNQ